jgi:hypothetical protein
VLKQNSSPRHSTPGSPFPRRAGGFEPNNGRHEQPSPAATSLPLARAAENQHKQQVWRGVWLKRPPRFFFPNHERAPRFFPRTMNGHEAPRSSEKRTPTDPRATGCVVLVCRTSVRLTKPCGLSREQPGLIFFMALTFLIFFNSKRISTIELPSCALQIIWITQKKVPLTRCAPESTIGCSRAMETFQE